MKLSRYILLPLLLFFSLVSNAQSNLQNSSFTDPTSNDLHLVNKALSSCEVLQEVVGGIEDTDNLSSNELFQRLQKVDSDGNLLIENKACSEDILEFVSSLCSSDSGTNRLFCSRLGFEQVSGTGGVSTDSYKSFGSVALGDLGDSDFEVSSTSGVSTLSNDDNKSTFSIAGVLFAFTPVKRLKLVSSFVRSRAVVSRPVLNGAMLILATLGLASCGDVTEPVAPKPVAPKPPDTPCTRGESGYFQLTNSASDCIKLINPPVISYLDEEGNVITDTSTITNHSIKVTFEEPVSFIDASEQGSLTSDNITKMIDVKLGSIDLLDVGFDFTIEIESNESSFTLTPETNYSAGDYTVGVSNYAKKADVSKIASSSNKSQYLSEINKLFSPSNFKVETLCSRGEDDYFELQNSNGLTDCIKLATPTISYLDKDENPVTDTSSIADHSIKVSFDGRVSYINSDRYEGLTAAFARGMIELDSNGTNLLSDTFRFSIEAGVDEDENSFFILTPGASYPAGGYSVKVKNYVNSSDASKVLSATNTDIYLALINQEHSSFSTPNMSTLCEKNASGYFELTNADGTKSCIRLPHVVFTFTPDGGREMIESNFEPTIVIRIYFDSEIVYLKEDGTYRDITKKDILEMVEISRRRTYAREGDHVSKDGAIGLDLVSVSHVGGKTVLTIGSPYDRTDDSDWIYGYGNPHNIVVKNFARKSDVSKIANSSSIGSYLEDTITFYHGIHSGLYKSTSCDLEYRPPASSYGRYHDQHSDGEEPYDFICEHDKMMDIFLSQSGDTAFDMTAFDVDETHLEKTDPGTRHVIDLAFITSDVLFENAKGDWRTYFEDKIIRVLDRIFQYSGVNVEFRVSLVEPFSDYRQYLYCDQPAIEHLVHRELGGDGEQAIMNELIPIIRKQHPADIFVVMTPYIGSYAAIGSGLTNFPVSARWSSTLVTWAPPDLFDMNRDDRHIEAIAGYVRQTLAHEIGHILRLDHDVDTMIEAGASAESLRSTIYWTNVTTFAYGYGGKNSDEPIGTIMSYHRTDQDIPLFSADKQILRSELCDTVGKIDGDQGSYGYCSNSDSNPDRLIKIGGSYKYGIFVDASEAMQYTIGIVSEYSDVGTAPFDLSTVSNAITAKALRVKGDPN